MAGPHQIWMLDRARGILWPYAGSGQEARIDGTIEEAAFAQPSGLAVAARRSTSPTPSRTSSARSSCRRPIAVRTLAGGDLFEFGDVDGKGDAVRLQHPLGVAMHDGRVVIADTYNHKIKLLDPATGKVWTLAGTGKPATRDGQGARRSSTSRAGSASPATPSSSPTRTITRSGRWMPGQGRRDDSGTIVR